MAHDVSSAPDWLQSGKENGEKYNPYHENGTGVYTNVKVYHKGDSSVSGFANGLDYQTYAQLKTDLTAGNVIIFDDMSFWDMTGTYPTFKAKEGKVAQLVLETKPVVEIKGENTTVDLGAYTDLFTNVLDAQVAGVSVFEGYSENKLTLNNANIPNVSSQIGKDTEIRISTDSGIYAFKANVYTKIITTAEELDKMLSEYALKTSVGTVTRAIGVEVFSYDGYFLLGNTIDYAKDGARGVYDSGVTYLRTNYYDSHANNPAVMNVAGFKGVFDGQGYAIKNVEFKSTMSANDVCFYTGGGLFGAIATDGVVKNLALKNVALSNTDGNATIAGTCCGTLDNISVDMVMENSTDVRVGALVLGTLGANISNVFVHITGMGGYRLRYGYVSLYDHARIEGETTVSTTVKNVYVARTSGTTQTVGQYLVGTAETGAYNPYDDEAGTFASVKVYDKEKPATTDANYGAFANGVDYQTYAQLATDLAAGNVIVFDDTVYWDLTGSYPTFKTKTVS